MNRKFFMLLLILAFVSLGSSSCRLLYRVDDSDRLSRPLNCWMIYDPSINAAREECYNFGWDQLPEDGGIHPTIP
jgi:hypothetical protein